VSALPLADVRAASVPGRIDGVDLEVGAGATVALIGANGAGKSSLLHVLAGRLRARGGTVRVAGHAPRSAAAARARAYVPQRIDLPTHVRAGEVLAVAAHARDADAAALRDAATRMGLHHVLADPVGRLSGGMQQRVALAAGLVGAPPLWLLDEPASALDAGGLARLGAWVADHAAAGGAVITSAHRPEEVAAFADDAVLLRGGRRLHRGPVDALFEVVDARDGAPLDLPEGAVPRRMPGPRLARALEGEDPHA
jgi:ABC-type multidrug transport system ATPase subunit